MGNLENNNYSHDNQVNNLLRVPSFLKLLNLQILTQKGKDGMK